jgi:hypothetical protein
MLVILVSGTRDPLTQRHKDLIRNEISKKVTKDNTYLLVHGNCSGVDKYAEEVALSLGCQVKRYNAEWKRYGRGAGPIRNQYMIDDSLPHIAIAFPSPSSIGTKDCIKRLETYSRRDDTRLISLDIIPIE